MSDATRHFTYAEALETFPTVKRITEAAVRQIEALLNRVQSRSELEARRQEIDQACHDIVEAWAEQVTGMGCVVKGMWLVDWDNGSGYYCWQYPEATLGHFHTYEDGFSGRVPIN